MKPDWGIIYLNVLSKGSFISEGKGYSLGTIVASAPVDAARCYSLQIPALSVFYLWLLF